MMKSNNPRVKIKNCITFSGLGFISLCFLIFLILSIAPDPYRPLKTYPNINDMRVFEEVSIPHYIEKTIFTTTDDPNQVYDFYQRQFLFRPFWRPSQTENGLRYSFSMGCPVGSYTINAHSFNGRTYVDINLRTHICI